MLNAYNLFAFVTSYVYYQLALRFLFFGRRRHDVLILTACFQRTQVSRHDRKTFSGHEGESSAPAVMPQEVWARLLLLSIFPTLRSLFTFTKAVIVKSVHERCTLFALSVFKPVLAAVSHKSLTQAQQLAITGEMGM